MRFVTLAPLLLAASTGIVTAQGRPPDLGISLPAETGLVVGHQESQGRAVLVELIPDGETVEDFKRMVTLQTAPGLGNVPEESYLREFGARYGAACPNTTITTVPFGSQGASGLRLDCPHHPATDSMETVFVRVMKLGDDLGVVQITMRYFPMPADGSWARDYLGRVTIQ